MSNPSLRHVCSFCGTDIAEVELLFRSDIGGCPPEICDGCIERYHEVLTLHRKAPKPASILIADTNRALVRLREEAQRRDARATP